MKFKLNSANLRLSRRAVLAAIAGTGLAALGRVRIGMAVEAIKPPTWVREAHEIIRNLQTPKIPKNELRISPVNRGAREIIQSAIDLLAQRGGGRVVLSAGVWRSDGPIRLRSQIELHLVDGARLVFSGNRRDYLPVVHTRWEGTELYGYSPFIYAYKVNDVAVTGPGRLEVDRSGDMEGWRLEQRDAQKKLRAMGATGVPLSERIFAEGSFLRPSLVQFFGCERALVEEISISAYPFWGIHLVYSENCAVRRVSINSDRVNNDGIDIDSSKRVLVEGCSFHTGDDCIAIKSGRDLDGRTIAKTSEEIVIRDCQMRYSKSAGVAIGSEMSGGVRRVYIFRCDMGRVDTALNIKSNLDRGGYVEHIRAWNLSVKECDTALQITTIYHGYMGGNFPPRFEDIELVDFRCKQAERAVTIHGDPQNVVRRVTLKAFHVDQARRDNEIVHVSDLQLEDVVVGTGMEGGRLFGPRSF